MVVGEWLDWGEVTARDRFPFASITMLPLDNTKEDVVDPRLTSVPTTRNTNSATIALVGVRVGVRDGTGPFKCRTHSPLKDIGQSTKTKAERETKTKTEDDDKDRSNKRR